PGRAAASGGARGQPGGAGVRHRRAAFGRIRAGGLVGDARARRLAFVQPRAVERSFRLARRRGAGDGPVFRRACIRRRGHGGRRASMRPAAASPSGPTSGPPDVVVPADGSDPVAAAAPDQGSPARAAPTEIAAEATGTDAAVARQETAQLASVSATTDAAPA